MAPELLRGEDSYCPEVDVFAFAILAYEIVTGEVLYSELGNVSSFVLANKVMSVYRPKLCSNIPKKMQSFLSRCWSENPRERPSFNEIHEYLSILGEGREIKASKLDDNKKDELLKQIKELKLQFSKLEGKLNVYSSTNNFYTSALEQLHGCETKGNTIPYLKRSSNDGNCYATFLLGLLTSK